MRRRSREGRAAGTSWQMGYAGFVTAMMALFIVLWILSSGDETRAAVAAHFQYPSVSVVRAGGVSFMSDRGLESYLRSLEKMREPEDSSDEVTPVMRAREDGRGSGSPQDGENLRQSAFLIEQALSESSTIFQAMERTSIEFISQGLRIQLHDGPGGSSIFEVGSAMPSRETRAILEAAGSVLASLPNEIVIEGHTDGRPFSGRPGYGNWELSGDRANSARRILESAGVNPDRIIRVIGYADRRPAIPENPLDARNRRISVIICYRESGPD